MTRQGGLFARWAAVVAFLVMALLPAMPGHAAEKVLVFAAASLKNALDEINIAWQAETGDSATISYAGSSALARQIEQGAPADIFISADLDWMDYLASKNLIKAESRAELLGNRLVLIAPADSAAQTEIGPDFPLAELLGGGRLAIAEVAAVPGGKYAKAALESLGVWASVEPMLAQTENVRAALRLVALGEAPLGIVYETDAAAEPGVRIVGAFPENIHPPIVYPVAVTSSSTHADAAGFIDFLRSEEARAVFERQGFTVLSPGPR